MVRLVLLASVVCRELVAPLGKSIAVENALIPKRITETVEGVESPVLSVGAVKRGFVVLLGKSIVMGLAPI